jgi:peroxiredoxin (alkyl hydroperoxide reductase subunit C)
VSDSLDGHFREAYGFQSKTNSVVIVNPNRFVAAILHYPVSVGRSIPEVLRLLDALQVTGERGAHAPANWKPGQDLVAIAPITMASARARTERT